MRKTILAMVTALLATFPAGAAAQRIVRDGSNPVPDVRIHTPRAGTSWQTPDRADDRSADRAATRFDTRDYRGMATGRDDAGLIDDGFPLYPDDYSDDDYGYGYGDGYAGEFRAEDRDRDYRRRVVRDDRDELDYDRDYPYEYAYRGGSQRPMIRIETVTTTTTEPTVRRVVRSR